MELRRTRITDEIPTASMADVAFLLVIFFMITTTFAATKALDMKLPEGPPPGVIDPVEAVLVEVEGGGALTVDGRSMALTDLLAYLEPKLRRNPGKPVLVRGLADAPYSAVVDVLDELRQGRRVLGLEREVSIALPTEREAARFWR
ncbi:MAG: biopolymer transporter ExbD [Acidobacteriota bacterium]|jgi:biopolymer transport protein ExbD